MSAWVFFRCEGCQARLKASVKLIGKSGSCPNCGHKVTVRPCVPAAEGPVLVTDDGHPQRRRVPVWF
jgi:hypothetical protein